MICALSAMFDKNVFHRIESLKNVQCLKIERILIDSTFLFAIAKITELIYAYFKKHKCTLCDQETGIQKPHLSVRIVLYLLWYVYM